MAATGSTDDLAATKAPKRTESMYFIELLNCIENEYNHTSDALADGSASSILDLLAGMLLWRAKCEVRLNVSDL